MKNIKYEYNIKEILKEIQNCYNNKNYFAALSMTLVLPDICSKIENKKDKSTREQYMQWCDKWLKCNFLENIYPIPFIDEKNIERNGWGDIIYQLRCGIMHNGENTVCDYKYDFFKIRKFNFHIDKNNDIYNIPIKFNQEIRTGQARLSNFQENNIVDIDINLGYLIDSIVRGTILFINNNKILFKKTSILSIDVLD